MHTNKSIFIFIFTVIIISGGSYLLLDEIENKIKEMMPKQTKKNSIEPEAFEPKVPEPKGEPVPLSGPDVFRNEIVEVPSQRCISKKVTFQDSLEEQSLGNEIPPNSAYILTDFPGAYPIPEFMTFPSENQIIIDGYTMSVPKFTRKN